MALLNKKRSFLLGIIIIMIICAYFMIFQKQKDYYVVESINSKVICYDKANNKIKIAISIKKQFVSKPKSRRYLLGGSMEDGLHGLKDRDLLITLSAIENSDIIKLNYYTTADSSIMNNSIEGTSKYKFYQNNTPLDSLISDMKENVKYTSGRDLDNVEMIFSVQVPKSVLIFHSNQELQLKLQNGSIRQEIKITIP